MTKHPYDLPLPTLVQTESALQEMLARLMVEGVVAVDTESNSLYAYNERVCLIQFSVPGEDYLVDPLAIENLAPLSALFSEPAIEKVFHAAEYDVMVLRRDFGFGFAALFDTMIASRILGWPRYGLGSLLKEQFGIQTDKRMQRTNWGRRPLSPGQLTYAQLDTHYLLPLRDRLLASLTDKARLVEAHTAFNRVAQTEWTERSFDPEGFWRIKGTRDLDDRGRAVLRALYTYRDQRAQTIDQPPFKVLSDRTLLELSRKCPKSLSELGRIKGLPRHLPPNAKRRLLSTIERGLRAQSPVRPERVPNNQRDQEEIERYEALRRWRKRCAQSRGVEPDVVLSNRILHVLAQRNPTSPKALDGIKALEDWERQTYGRELVAVLRRQDRIGSG